MIFLRNYIHYISTLPALPLTKIILAAGVNICESLICVKYVRAIKSAQVGERVAYNPCEVGVLIKMRDIRYKCR